MIIEAEVFSHIGKKRKINEDCAGISEDKKIMVVCDGMGGHNAGEIASKITVDTILTQQGIPVEMPELIEDAKRLVGNIRFANRKIVSLQYQNPEMAGMGTTVVAIQVSDSKIIIAHVGDSRTYRLRKNKIERLTQDHSYVSELVQDGQLTEEEAAHFKEKNVLTRALGREKVKVDVRIESIKENDIYLLCTDGVWNEVNDKEIEEILLKNISNIKQAGNELIQLANDRGGKDNITLGIMKIYNVKEEIDEESLFFSIPEETKEEIIAEDKMLKKLTRPKKKIAKTISLIGIGIIVCLGLGILTVKNKTKTETSPSTVYHQVTIESVPAGALVKINNKEYPPTPLICSLIPGNHLLKLSKEGYKEENIPFTLNKDTTISVTLSLKSYLSLVFMYGGEYSPDEVKKCSVFVDGKFEGEISKFYKSDELTATIPLPLGKEYHISLRLYGKEIYSRKGNIESPWKVKILK